MPGPAAILNILITANNAQAMATIAKTDAAMKASAATAESAASRTAASYARTGQKLSTVGSAMTKYISVPAAAVGVASVKMAKDFNDAMMQIHTSAGASTKEVERMHDAILALARSGKVEQGPKQLAEGLFHIESQGFRSAKALKILEAAAQGADIGNASLEDTTRALGGVMRALHAPAGQATAIMSQLIKIVGQGDMRMQELVSALSTGVVPAARTFGLSLRDVGAALDVMTQRNMGATQSATRLRMTFSMLASPSDTARAALESIGLSADELANTMREKNLPAAIALLAQHLEGISKTRAGQILSQAFGGGRTSAAIMLLVQNVGELRQAYAGAGQDVAGFNEKLRADAETTQSKLNVAWAQIQASLISVGESLGPVVAKMAQMLAEISKIAAKIPAFAELLVLAFAAGPIIKFIGWIYKLRAAYLSLAAAQATAAASGAAAGAGAGGGVFGGMVAGLTRFIPLIGAATIAVTGFYAALKTARSPGELGGIGDIERMKLNEELFGQIIEKMKASEKGFTAARKAEVARRILEYQREGKITAEWASQTIGKFGTTAQQVALLAQRITAGGAGPLQKYGQDVVNTIDQMVKHANAAARNIMPRSVEQRVADSFMAIHQIFKSGLNKLVGITQKDMLFIAMHMQQGPERGRQAMQVVFNKMVNNIKTAMNNGTITVSQGVRKIMNILKTEAEALGIPYKPLSWLPANLNLPLKPQKPQKGAILVPGRGTGDKVPILAEPGEVVLNRNAVAAMGGAQKAHGLNRMFPRFAKGGPIPTFPDSVVPGFVDNIALGATNRGGDAARIWLAAMKKRAGAGANASWASIDKLAKKSGLSISSTYRPGDTDSWHGRPMSGGRSHATDYSGGAGGMMALFRALVPLARKHKLHELFYDPGGGWDEGTSIGAIGGHMDHVHVALQRGGVVKGKVSTFGPPLEAAGTTASGVSSSQPGIAIYDHSTLGKLFKMVIGSHKAPLTQTDYGPAPWTGRKLDVTGAGARKMGIDPRHFPTDAMGKAWRISGKTKAPKKVSTTKVKGGSTTTPPWSISLPAGLADTMRILGEDVNRFGDFSSRAAEWGPLGGLDEIGWLTNQLGALQQLREIVLQAVRWLQMVIQRYQEAIDKAQKEIRKFRKDKKRVKGLEAQIQKWETRRDITKGVLNGEEGPLAKLSELQDPLINPSLAFRSLNLFDPALGGMFGGTIGEVQSALRAAGEKVKTAGYGTHALPINLSQFFPGFAMGGIVPGTGEPLILAHGGELIVPKGMQGGGVVGGQAGADVLAAVGPFGTGSQLEQLGAAGALAELTSGILDDIAVYINLVAYWTQELARLQSIGAPATEIQTAAGALASAQQALSGLQADAVLGPLEAAVALAQLTATLGDDVTAQAALVKYWTDKLASLIASGATPAEIAAAAGSLASAQQTLDQLNADLILGPLEMAVALAGLTADLGDDVAAQAALVKYYSDLLAKLIAEGANPAEITAAANALASAQSALSDLEKKKALEPIEMAAALAQLTADTADDIAAATDLVKYWEEILKNLQAAGGSMVDITEAANALYSAQQALESLTKQTEKAADATAQQDWLKQQLLTAQRAYQVSQAQYPVLRNMPRFGGSFAGGGIVPGPTGAPRMILAHGGEAVGQGIQVIINGDIVNTPRGKDPVEVVIGDRRFSNAVRNVTGHRAVRPLQSSGGQY